MVGTQPALETAVPLGGGAGWFRGLTSACPPSLSPFHLDLSLPMCSGGQPKEMAPLRVLPRDWPQFRPNRKSSGQREVQSCWDGSVSLGCPSVCYVLGVCACLPSLSIPLFLTFCTFQMSPPPQIPSETAHGRQAQVLLPEESEVGLK